MGGVQMERAVAEAREREMGITADIPDFRKGSVRLSVEHLDLFYGEHHALKDVSIDIRDKQITSFIGPSGCGKSTLLRCFNRMNDDVKGCRIEGRVALDGEDIYRDVSASAWCSSAPTPSR